MCRPTKPATSSTASSITLKARTSAPCVRHGSLHRVRVRVRVRVLGRSPGRTFLHAGPASTWHMPASHQRAGCPCKHGGADAFGRYVVVPLFPRPVFVYSCPGFSLNVRERMLYASCKSPLLDLIEGELKIEVTRKMEIENGTEFTHEEFYNSLHPVKQVLGGALLVPWAQAPSCISRVAFSASQNGVLVTRRSTR